MGLQPYALIDIWEFHHFKQLNRPCLCTYKTRVFTFEIVTSRSQWMNIPKEDQIYIIESSTVYWSIVNVLHRSAYNKKMAIKDLLIIKTLFLTYIFYVSKACATTTRVQPARALQINCEYFSNWTSVDWGNEHIHEEAGKICQFNVDSISSQEHWSMGDFSCGSSSRRIVMCEKAFDLFKFVSTKYQS